MRINIYGNMSNNNYQLAKHLRRKGIDARIFIELDNKPECMPEHADPELRENGYPPWIIPIKNLKKNVSLRYYLKFAKMLGEDCDLIMVSHVGPYFAQLTGKPYFFYPYGWDITTAPFLKGFPGRLIAYFQRIGIRHAAMTNLGASAITPEYTHAREKLNLTKVVTLPYPIDTDKFQTYNNKKIQQLRQEKLGSNYDLIIFHPTRQVWSPNHPDSYEIKGNDLLFKAVARAVQETGKQILVIATELGVDLEKSKKLVEGLRIKDNVQWIPEQNFQGLIDYYNLGDLVADQFINGTPGTIILEALACGKPVLAYLKDITFMVRENPPTLNAQTEQEIFKHIKRLLGQPEQIKQIGSASRQWILNYYGWKVVIDKYIDLFKQMVDTGRG